MNSLWRCGGSILINPSARIVLLGVHWMTILSFCTSWRNQCRCISTWRSLMLNEASRAVNARMIWRLSHFMWMSDIWKVMTSKNLSHHILVLAVMNITNSFASMTLIMIVFCLLAFQSIISLKSLKQYFCELWRVRKSSVKEAFEEPKNIKLILIVWLLKTFS